MGERKAAPNERPKREMGGREKDNPRERKRARMNEREKGREGDEETVGKRERGGRFASSQAIIARIAPLGST